MIYKLPLRNKTKSRKKKKNLFSGGGGGKQVKCHTSRIPKRWLHQMPGPGFEMSNLYVSTHRLGQKAQGILDGIAF